MTNHYLKTGIRNILKNKKISFINIIGFAFAMSICIAMVIFLLNEYSFDRYHKNSDRIYRLTDIERNSSNIDYRVKNILQENFSEIEDACLIQKIAANIEVRVGNKGLFLNDIMSVDNRFFQVFTIPFIKGNYKEPFANLNSAVITESTAKKLFGNEDPIGKELLHRKTPLTITGVIKDFPTTSSISAGLLVNAANNENKFASSCDNIICRFPFEIYLLLKKNIDQDLFSANINKQAEKFVPYVTSIGLLPLAGIYLNDKTTDSGNKKGNSALLKLLATIAIIVLIIAVINYINLTIAQQTRRNKDAGLRKTIGAHRKNLINLYLTESFLTIFAAFIISLLCVEAMVPFYNDIFDSQLSLLSICRFPVSLLILSSILFIGFSAGIGPAMILSSTTPINAVNSEFALKKNHFRNSLTVFQFAVSVVLIFCIITIQRQIYFVKHKDKGFSEERLVRLDLPVLSKPEATKVKLLTDKFNQSPYIICCSCSDGSPGEINLRMGYKDNHEIFPTIISDTNFIKTFNIQLKLGRNLQPGDFGHVCMINEAAYHQLGWNNLEDKKFEYYEQGRFKVIGVVNNFNYYSMHKAIEPMCIIFEQAQPTTISIRLTENSTSQGITYIRTAWKEAFPGRPLNYQFYNDWFNSMYRKEEKLGKIIGLFAMLAVGISCVGILGLAIFSSEKRTKEIGIRKVNGAKISEILIMLNKDFIKWITIAFMIAFPIAWYAMNKWLQNFAYKTELSWWIFVAAGAAALVIALITVSWQSFRAATRNPVEALRYE